MLRFLDASEAEAQGLPWPDVYFTPQYGRAVEVSDDARWEVAVYEPGPIVYPYLRRPVDESLVGTSEAFDIVSPYGYAGTWGPPALSSEAWRRFRSSLREALAERGAVAEYQRLSPLVNGGREVLDADDELTCRWKTDIFVVDLRDGYDRCWERMEGRSRTKVRKVRNLGYEDRVVPADEQLVGPASRFRQLYDDTMRRTEARPYYLFSDEYFRRLANGLSGGLHLLEILSPEGEIVGTGLFMTHGSTVHAHLTGTHGAPVNGLSNLLYDRMMAWGCEQGFERMNVGGGYAGGGDGLHRFKQGFGGEARQVQMTSSVLEPGLYDRAVAARSKQLGQSAQELEEGGFFPAYRTG